MNSKKWHVSGSETKSGRLDLSGTGNHYDRCHEFYPMIRAFMISLQTGAGANMRFADPIFSNYKRIMVDKVFQQSIVNTFLYLIIQVPIMLVLYPARTASE